MNRFFLPVATVVVVLFACLSWFAYRAIELEIAGERNARHAARDDLARRIADAAQDDFDAFLADENARPFYHYQYLYVPEDVTGAGQSLLRSPIGSTAGRTYAAAFFQLDPRGRFTTPAFSEEFSPRDSEAAAAQQSLAAAVLPILRAQAANRNRVRMAHIPSDYSVTATLRTHDRIVTQASGNVSLNSRIAELFRQQRLAAADSRIIFLQPSHSALIGVIYSPFFPVGDSTAPSGLQVRPLVFLRHVELLQHAFLQGFLLNRVYLTDRVTALAGNITGGELGIRLDQGTYRIAYPFGAVSFDLVPADATFVAMDTHRRLRQFTLIGAAGLVLLASLLFFHRLILRQTELARRKDDFIAAVSHELRTPLASILMYAELLDENWVADAARRHAYLGHIRQEGSRLNRLVENILDFSRLGRRRRAFHGEPHDLGALVEETLAAFKPRLDQEGFRVGMDIESAVCVCDRDAMTQVLVNLIDNAIKFSDTARELSLSVRPHADTVVVEVSDRGRGVPTSDHDRIFQPFFRAEHEMTRSTPGVGLGLALVKLLVQGQGGRITVRPRHGGGTTFSLALPLPASSPPRASSSLND